MNPVLADSCELNRAMPKSQICGGGHRHGMREPHRLSRTPHSRKHARAVHTRPYLAAELFVEQHVARLEVTVDDV